MTLPPLSIPNIPLPFEIPGMIHPLLAHFAIVLPVVVLLLELINLFTKKRTIGVLSFFFMVLAAIVFFVAYLTGTTDGKMAKEFLSPEAKDALMAHKQLGIYLVYASGLVLLFKLFSILIRKTAIKILFFLVLLVFVVAIFNEGKKGGELVYQYGVNVKSVPAIGKAVVEKVPAITEDNITIPAVVDKKSDSTPDINQSLTITTSTAEVNVTEGNISQ